MQTAYKAIYEDLFFHGLVDGAVRRQGPVELTFPAGWMPDVEPRSAILDGFTVLYEVLAGRAVTYAWLRGHSSRYSVLAGLLPDALDAMVTSALSRSRPLTNTWDLVRFRPDVTGIEQIKVLYQRLNDTLDLIVTVHDLGLGADLTQLAILLGGLQQHLAYRITPTGQQRPAGSIHLCAATATVPLARLPGVSVIPVNPTQSQGRFLWLPDATELLARYPDGDVLRIAAERRLVYNAPFKDLPYPVVFERETFPPHHADLDVIAEDLSDADDLAPWAAGVV